MSWVATQTILFDSPATFWIPPRRDPSFGHDICGIMDPVGVAENQWLAMLQSSPGHYESRPRQATGQGFGAGLRSRLREVSEQIKADLNRTGQVHLYR